MNVYNNSYALKLRSSLNNQYFLLNCARFPKTCKQKLKFQSNFMIGPDFVIAWRKQNAGFPQN
jgi:hypothetical protein